MCIRDRFYIRMIVRHTAKRKGTNEFKTGPLPVMPIAKSYALSLIHIFNVPFGIYRITGHTTIRTGRALHADLLRNNRQVKQVGQAQILAVD